MLLADYISQELGTTKWFAGRLTEKLALKYDVTISKKRHTALKLAWEIQEFGAPVEALHRASPALLAALRLFVDDARGIRQSGLIDYTFDEKIAIATDAVLRAGASIDTPPTKRPRLTGPAAVDQPRLAITHEKAA